MQFKNFGYFFLLKIKNSITIKKSPSGSPINHNKPERGDIKELTVPNEHESCYIEFSNPFFSARYYDKSSKCYQFQSR